MQGYEVKFNIYASSQAEAEEAARSIKNFIGRLAAKGIAVTGRKITAAVNRWSDNMIVQNYFK